MRFTTTQHETIEQLQEKKREEQSRLDDWYANTATDDCENNLKGKLRDPESYVRDAEFTTPTDDGKDKIITWGFRSKNGFGGYNSAVAMCYASKKDGGTLSTEIVSE